MAPITAAVRKGAALHLMQNLLNGLNGRSNPSEVSKGDKLNFKLRYDVTLRMDVPQGETFSVDIKSGGEITVFFLAEVYAESISVSLDLNRIIGAGTPLFEFCLVPRPWGGCAVPVRLKMPRIDPIKITLSAHAVGLSSIPVAAFNAYFQVREIVSGDHIDDEKRAMMAKLVLFAPPTLRFNNAQFAAILVDKIIEAALNTIGKIPVFGQIIRYVGWFLHRIADGLRHTLALLDSWLSFVEGEVKQAVLGVIAHAIWEPTIKVKIGSMKARKQLAAEFTGPTGQKQPPVFVSFNPITIDVNTDCSEPELRVRLTPV